MSVFSDDWRDCLREQYKYVIQDQDQVTERSLTEVMHQVGFGDEELRVLRVEATMRAEDVSEDFQPDLAILDAVQPVEAPFQPHPAECQCPGCVDINLVPHDEEGQPLPVDPEEEADRRKDDDSAQQLSLF